MTIVTTGMHFTRHKAGMVSSGGLFNRQGIHISTQPDHRPLIAAPDQGHYARLRNAIVYFGDPKLLQPRNHKRSRLVALKSKLRILMQMAAPGFHILSKFSDTVDDRHELTPNGIRKP
jgi:hypothetical protein